MSVARKFATNCWNAYVVRCSDDSDDGDDDDDDAADENDDSIQLVACSNETVQEIIKNMMGTQFPEDHNCNSHRTATNSSLFWNHRSQKPSG